MKWRRKLVYTCVFSGYDDLRSPHTLNEGVHFVCITDDPSLTAPGWDVRVLDARREGLQDLDATRQSRYAKILPHRMFPDFDASLYVDANLESVGPVDPLFAHLETHHVVFFRHPENRTDVYAEAEKCIALGKDDPARIREQVDRYKATGFEGKSDPRFETIPTGMIILRNHQMDDVRETMEFWWSEYLKGSRRDQLSLPYVLHTSGQAHTLLDEYVRSNEFFEWRAHDSVQAARDAGKRFAGANAVIMYSLGPRAEGLAGAIEAGRHAARSPFEKLAARAVNSVSRRELGCKLAVGPVPRLGNLARLTAEEWGRSLGLSGVPIAYVVSEPADSDQKRTDGHLRKILRSHNAPSVVVTIEDLRAGRSTKLVEWCVRAGFRMDAQTLTRKLVGQT